MLHIFGKDWHMKYNISSKLNTNIPLNFMFNSIYIIIFCLVFSGCSSVGMNKPAEHLSLYAAISMSPVGERNTLVFITYKRSYLQSSVEMKKRTSEGTFVTLVTSLQTTYDAENDLSVITWVYKIPKPINEISLSDDDFTNTDYKLIGDIKG